jgi:putative transposase
VEAQALAGIKKNAARLGAHIVFVDESGFMIIPPVRRTWALVGQTPILRHFYRRDRISVIGGLSISPQRHRLGLYFRMHPKNISQEEVHDFLWYLLRHLRGHVIVVWDGASIHDPKSLTALRRRYPRLHLERLPAYAPQLNPVEAAWHAAKHPLANGRPDDIYDLGRALLKSLRQARASQATLRGCVLQSELPSFLR